MNELGNLYKNHLNNFKEAEFFYKNAIENNKDNQEAYNNLI